jgi:hypothetical protein
MEQTLAQSIDWNWARVKFLARFLIALFTVKSVCLTQIASVFPGEAQVGSHYKRLQRFLRGFDLDFATLARLLARLSGAHAPFVLALDRTDWKLGRIHLNILMLVIVHQGIGFPVLWCVLCKAGASDTRERIALLARFVAIFGKEQIGFVCADREFASQGLLAWLVEQKIGYRLRLKANALLSNHKGQAVSARRFFQNCPRQQERHLSGRRRCLGQSVCVAGTRLAGDYLIVISDQPAPLSDYALRWGIETLFGALKRRGFCLETTHVTQAPRLEKLLALLAIAFAWAFAVGEQEDQRQPTPHKKHGRLARSRFRRGLDRLRRLLCPLAGGARENEVKNVLRFLSCT